MREVVTVQLGHCGNMVGCKYWEVMCDEHGITPVGTFCGDCDLQLGSACVFFREGLGMRFIPRAVLVDLEPSALDACRCSPFGQIYRPDNFVFGRAGASNNFAKGYYTDGAELLGPVLETVRRETEACDFVAGFQIVHGLGGGTGSGLGSLFLEKLYDLYNKKIITTYSVFPSARVSDTVVEPYNCVLSIPALMKFASMTVCFDNEALYNICRNTLRLTTPTFDDINHIMAVVMSGTTACLRYPGFTNVGLRKLKTALTPYPGLHFFVPGYAPLSSRGAQPYRSLSLLDIVQQMLDGSTLMASIDPRNGKYITAAALFRGNIADGFLEQLVCEFQRKNTKHFIDWLPSYFTKGVCLVPPRGLKIAATFLANHTSILGMWKRIRDGYNKLYKKKAFLHWYTGEGMTEKDFTKAGTCLNTLISEYEKYEKALPQSQDDSDEEE